MEFCVHVHETEWVSSPKNAAKAPFWAVFLHLREQISSVEAGERRNADALFLYGALLGCNFRQGWSLRNPHLKSEMWGTRQQQKQIPEGNDRQKGKSRSRSRS